VSVCIALVSVDEARALDEDLPPLTAALERLGFAVDSPSWDDANIDWPKYAIVIIRSTWDYTDRPAQFVAWTEAVNRKTSLHNPPQIVAWNIDKHYLLALEKAGVPIVPTQFADLESAAQFPASGDFVVKPAIGAGSRGAKRFAAGDFRGAESHVAALRAAGHCPMVQPYLSSVDTLGETALVFFNGEYSHAFRKGPLLAAGKAGVRGLFAPESIQARVPGDDELHAARRAIAAIPGQVPLYARVDLIRDGGGAPRLLELELAEPSLYFNYAPGSADRFAAAIGRLARRRC
jgi:O-ureido-D-serine cyclo-ligase